MKRFIISLLALFTCATAGAQFPNITLDESGLPEEPSIAIDPSNPERMVAGSNIDHTYYSSDGGLTWNAGILTSSFGVYGDPCIVADTAGNFFYFHLSNPLAGSWLDRMVCQKSTDGGQTWSDGSYSGLNGSKDQDKEWGIVNPFNNHLYLTWTQFDSYGSQSPFDSTVILFSKSTDGGDSWSIPVRINREAGDCMDEDNTVEGAVPAVGPEGQIYAAWAGPGGLMFSRSFDEGETWPAENVFVSEIPGGWDYQIPGISRANGLPITCCDLSEGPYRGNIYINWSDQRNGSSDTDVWFVRSTDGGLSWSEPIRVNDDPPGKQQFFTWMAVDPSDGFIYIVFYDRRGSEGNETNVYLAVSRDGGITFENMRINETPFLPTASIFFGDYTCISAVNGIVRPIWTELNQGQLRVQTALIDSLFTGIHPFTETPVPFSMDQNYPNPVEGQTWFSFKLHRPAQVSLTVCDVYGRKVAVLMDRRFLQTGKYIEPFNVKAAGLSPGLYYFSLESSERSLKRKMIVQ